MRITIGVEDDESMREAWRIKDLLHADNGAKVEIVSFVDDRPRGA